MVLRIKYLQGLDRPWLLKRVNGKYEQHSHFKTKKEAVKCKNRIEAWRYPHNSYQRTSMQRILTEEEFKSLNYKQQYFNSNRGMRR